MMCGRLDLDPRVGEEVTDVNSFSQAPDIWTLPRIFCCVKFNLKINISIKRSVSGCLENRSPPYFEDTIAWHPPDGMSMDSAR